MKVHKPLLAYAAIFSGMVFLCGTPVDATAQIVNIESSRMQSDTTGWKGSVGASFSITKNIQQIIQLDGNAHIQYKTKKNLYLILGNYTLLRGADQQLINNTFLHLRYNRKISELLRWEVFTQIQSNVVTGIQSRFLLGTGPRFKVMDHPQFKLYAATLVMYEEEKERMKNIPVHDDIRNSSYVSFTYKPNSIIELVSTSFYQPLMNNIGDFRVLNQESLKITATKRLAFTLNWNYLYDSDPAVNNPKTNYVFSTGFNYVF